MKPQAILKELEEVFAALSAAAPEALAEQVTAAQRIFVCGAGRSGLALKMFAMRLAQMGKCAFVAGETTTPAIGKGDLLLAASASGTTPGVCRNAEIAKRAEAAVYVITAAPQSALAQENRALVLPCRHKNSGAGEGMQPMGSLFEQALLILLDGCVLSCMEKMQETGKSMRERHANLE